MPLDKWTIIDIITCFFNIICFNVIGSITEEQITDRSQKQVLDYYVIAVVIVGWMRFFAYFLIIQFISKLLMTLIRMITDTLSFLFIAVCYMLLASTVFMMLFASPTKAQREALELKGEESTGVSNYDSYFYAMRTVFDGMLAVYSYEIQEEYGISYSIFTVTHVFIINIFLLNYLVAILSMVYNEMHERGEFSFKSNKYMFIEKYKIAMEDKTGYAQLVIYPPPLNFFSLFIMPFTLSKGNMLRMSSGYQKFIYWVENFFFSIAFLFYEFLFLPFIYLKVFYNVIKLSSWDNLMIVFFIWLIAGPFFLLFNIVVDFYNFMKILCDMDEDEEMVKEREREDFKQDKIVIYNEMIDVMKGIRHIKIRHFMDEERKRRRKKGIHDVVTLEDV